MKLIKQQILDCLPYGPSFRFVDEILSIDDNKVVGRFRYAPQLVFYRDHFPGNPITPGAILLETMAQIGLVCLGIYLTRAFENRQGLDFVFTSSNVHYLKKVPPNSTIIVESEKVYFRLGKLKCNTTMYFEEGKERICYGDLAGMIV